MFLQIIYQMREQLIVNSLYEVEACGYGVSSVASVSGGLAAEPVDELVLVADEQIEAAVTCKSLGAVSNGIMDSDDKRSWASRVLQDDVDTENVCAANVTNDEVDAAGICKDNTNSVSIPVISILKALLTVHFIVACSGIFFGEWLAKY